MLLAARLLSGICLGTGVPVGQIYLAEISSPNIRGMISGSTILWQVFFTTINYALGSTISWFHLALFNAAVVIAYFPIMYVTPESPNWLLSKNRLKEARGSLKFLRSAETDIEPDVKRILEHIENSKTKIVSCRDIFQWDYLKSITLLFIFIILRQSTGVFAVLNYTVEIFRDAGGSLGAYKSTIIIGCVHFVFLLISNYLSDLIGRKRLIVVSATFMSIGSGLLAFHYFHKTFNWLPLLALLLYIIAFSCGMASSIFIFMGELIPYKIKNYATGWANIINQVTNFCAVYFYYDLKNAITQSGVFMFYSCLCAVLAVYSAFVLPETKRQNLEDLENQLTKSYNKNIN
jgi:MFS family permease